MWKRHTGKHPARRQGNFAARAGSANVYRPKCENLEDRSVPSILFSSTGSRTITDSGGPVLSAMQVDLIFWGSGWNFAVPGLKDNIAAAARTVLNSHDFDGLSQYRSIGHGSLLRTDTITTSSPPASFTTAAGGDVSTFVANNINNGTLPAPNGHILYFVVPQPGSATSDCGCGGRHLAGIASSNRVFPYGLVSDPAGTSVDTLSWIMSHEFVEAATNPEWNITVGGVSQAAFHVPGSNGDEIGDGEPDGTYLYPVKDNATPPNTTLVQAYLSQRDHAYIVTDGTTQNFLVSSSRVLTINGDQLANKSDTIAIDDINGAVRAYMNGETVQFTPGAINSVVINTGTGNDTVNIQGNEWPVTVNLGGGTDAVTVGDLYHNLDRIRATVTANAGTGGDALYVYDTANTRSDSWTLDSGTIGRTNAATIHYSGSFNRDLRIFGGTGSPTYTVRNTSANLEVGAASATVNVLTSPSALNIHGSAANLTVNVGSAGSVQAIQGEITIYNPGGHSNITVDDRNDALSKAPALSTDPGDASYGQITGLAPGAIYYHYADTASLVVFTGTNTATVNVLATGANVNDLGADDPQGTTMNLGNAGSVQQILGSMSLSNLSGPLTVNVNDQSDMGNRSVMLDAFNSGLEFIKLTGFTAATIFATSAGPGNFTVNGGSGSNTFNVANTAPNTTTTINGGAGVNTFRVQATAAGSTTNLNGSSSNEFVLEGNDLTLNAIQGAVTLTASGTGNFAVLDDQFDTADETYTFTANTLNRTGLAPITYQNSAGFPELILYPGSGNNNIVWQSTAVFPYLIVAAPVGGNDTLVGPDGAANLWQLVDGVNDELFVNGNVAVAFQRISNLVGGSGSNTFQFSDGYQLPGSITGGAGGINTLDYTAYTTGVDVNFQAGAVTGVAGGVSNIQNVIGGQGSNILVGDGNENLTGGTGQNLIISGGGATQLTGGGAGDILIGGTTAYDLDDASLQAILSYWTTSGDDYPTRVANLRAGNGVPQLEGGVTVFDQDALDQNGPANTLTGNGSEDQGIFNLFYVTEAGTVTDQQPDEVVVNIDNPAGAPRPPSHAAPGSLARESQSLATAADRYFLRHRDEMAGVNVLPGRAQRVHTAAEIYPAWIAPGLDVFAP